MAGLQRHIEPELLGDDVRLTLAELSRVCSVHAEWVVELVNEGVLDPEGSGASSWRFSARSVRRARIARNLMRDLGVNLAGAALALSLLEEMEQLRNSIRLPGAGA